MCSASFRGFGRTRLVIGHWFQTHRQAAGPPAACAAGAVSLLRVPSSAHFSKFRREMVGAVSKTDTLKTRKAMASQTPYSVPGEEFGLAQQRYVKSHRNLLRTCLRMLRRAFAP